jgi:molybdenum cofactor guanylyltransferase
VIQTSPWYVPEQQFAICYLLFAILVVPSTLLPFSAALLAGGRSRRMGRDKRLLVVDWEREPVPLWKRQLNVLRRLAPVELLISGPGDLEYPPDAKVVPDKIQDAGALAGIASCLEAAQSKLLLILAVDVPNITPDYLMSLVRGARPGCGVVPAIERALEPVIAVYPVEAVTTAAACLQAGELSVQAFARRLAETGLVSIRTVTANEALLFRNWNSPRDREET